MRKRTYYHGTPDADFDPTEDNPEIGRFDLCLTDDEGVAEMYAKDRARCDDEARIFTVEIDQSVGYLADEEEATEIACEVWGVDSLNVWLFEALDDPAVMEAIVEAGFIGVEFVDQCPGVYSEHDTVRIYDANAVIGCQEA